MDVDASADCMIP